MHHALEQKPFQDASGRAEWGGGAAGTTEGRAGGRAAPPQRWKAQNQD